MIDIFLPGTKMNRHGGSPNSFARITIEAYIIDNLDANLLLANDTLGPLQAILDFKRRSFALGATGLVTPIKVEVRTRATLIDRPLKAV